MPRIKYRLGLDLGANSLGWCVYRLDSEDEPVAIVRMGSRVFTDGRDPKTLASRAADRRLARQARRRRDRVLKRRQRLIHGLIRFGLMPNDEAERKTLQASDPFELRARGLDEKISLHELGRALYHLCRKRGFRSSRKDGSSTEDEKETGKVKAAIKRLREQVEDASCRTVGEYLAKQHRERKPVRARRSSDGQYVLYLQRDMVADEFDQLWEAQRRFHPDALTEQAREYLRDTLLFQRRLLPVIPGRCLFETDEYRAPLCSPLQQRFRILQELNNLRLVEGTDQRALTLAERNTLLNDLLHHPKRTFAQLRAAIGHGRASNARFNLESDKRKDLKGDLVSTQLSDSACIGQEWYDWPIEQQEGLALLIARADRAEDLIAALQTLPRDIAPAIEAARPHAHEAHLIRSLANLRAPFSDEQARALSTIRVPDDYGSLSRKALLRIVPELEHEVVTYDIAVQRAGYQHHSALHSGEFHDRLPYYGEILRGYTSPADKAKDDAERRYGKIPNPTVHIGLNQLRQLVNALIRRYGHPHQIIIEMTREFGVSGEKRRQIEKDQTANQERNARYDTELERLGQRPNRENRQKLQLWEELGSADALDRHCVYTGQRLSKSLLFSDEVEVDHILPFSRSLHDGIGNKILCARQGNRDKGNRTPFEAWGQDTQRWAEIEARAERLPTHKRKLFRDRALEEFLGDGDFLARHLTDTAYLSRAAKQYLSYICHKDYVWVSSGKLTGMLRAKFGLNRLLSDDSSKNRNDHRHHALDSAVIGLCSRSLIQRMSRAAKDAESHGKSRLLESLELPWPSYREELAKSLSSIVVSHKPDHGRQAALHNDTNYGLRDAPDKSGNPLVGRRRSLDEITSVALAESVADSSLRQELIDLLRALGSTKEIKAALQAFSKRTGIRRVICQERLAVIPIHDRRSGLPYRYVKGDGNHCYEIFRKADGRWDGEIISNFSANQSAFKQSATHAQNGLPLVMRVRKDDVLAVEEGDRLRYLRVAVFTRGSIKMIEPKEANVDARTRSKEGDLKYVIKAPSALKPLRARLVGVNILGYVNDPGFKP